ncbi:MAG: DUF1207 domain-containing protein [Bacteroidota bacterium]|nr:DUF1207 domain-containing protein [Bacteroidota bacterium]
MNKKLAAVAFVLIFFSTVFAQEKSFSISLLPEKKLYPYYGADMRAHRIAFSKLFKNNEVIGGLGGLFHVANISYGNYEGQFSVATTLYTQLKVPYRQTQVINHDFFVDLLFDIELNPASVVRLGMGHTSQHLSDDAFEVLGFTKSVDYVRDYYRLGYVYRTDLIKGFVYTDLNYIYNFKINEKILQPWMIQLGTEALNTPISEHLTAYVGVDIKMLQILNFASSQTYQLGIKYRNEHSDRTMRFALNYQAGKDERGQFYLQNSNWLTVGMYFEF